MFELWLYVLHNLFVFVVVVLVHDVDFVVQVKPARLKQWESSSCNAGVVEDRIDHAMMNCKGMQGCVLPQLTRWRGVSKQNKEKMKGNVCSTHCD